MRDFFEKYLDNIKDLENGFDFSIDIGHDCFYVEFGIEPSYKFDPYIRFVFDSNFEECSIERGRATGYYDSDIVLNEFIQWNDMDENNGFRWLAEIYRKKLMDCLEEDK